MRAKKVCGPTVGLSFLALCSNFQFPLEEFFLVLGGEVPPPTSISLWDIR